MKEMSRTFKEKTINVHSLIKEGFYEKDIQYICK